MKKLLACALIFVMCLGSLAACGKEQEADPTPTAAPTTAPTEAPAVDTVSDLVNAKNYLFTMYKDQTEATPVDYTVVGVVNIGGVLFPIEWIFSHFVVSLFFPFMPLFSSIFLITKIVIHILIQYVYLYLRLCIYNILLLCPPVKFYQYILYLDFTDKRAY